MTRLLYCVLINSLSRQTVAAVEVSYDFSLFSRASS
jgi:hypothetical protein